jgi:hypothetical protein
VTSTVIGLTASTSINNAGTDQNVAYCFAEVPGYSKFGSYTGNGAADGPFIYCGFKPRWIMFKPTSTTGGWTIYDGARNSINVLGNELYAHSSASEGGSMTGLDLLANGFKLRNSAFDPNISGATIVFAAFAEAPFKYATAR